MKHDCSLKDSMMDLFDKIEEGAQLSKAGKTPIPGGKVFNITYLLIIRSEGMKNPLSGFNTYWLSKRTIRTSRIYLCSYTGANISARNPHPLPMDMVLQQTICRKNMPR